MSTKEISPRLEPANEDLPVRFRSWLIFLLGIPLSFLSFFLVVSIEETIHIGQPTGLAIYYHVIAIFFVVLIANYIVGMASYRRFSLSSAELICLYSMMNIGGCFASWESLGTLVPALAYPVHMMSSRGDYAWLEPVVSALPNWAVVKDPTAANALFQGGTFLSMWRSWLLPMASWSAIIATIFVMFLATSRLLWESWLENEHLSFPLTILPLQMTQTAAPLWRSRVFWWIFCGSFGLDFLNGLHVIAPGFPTLYDKVNWINSYSLDPAWKAVGQIPLTCHPLMIGIGLLLRSDLLFSTWFFYIAGQTEIYVSGLLGSAHGSKYVLLNNSPGLLAQNFGAFMVIACSILMNSREVLRARFTAMIKGNWLDAVDLYVVILGTVILVAALGQLGLSPILAIIVVVVMLLLAIFVSRLRAELGLPVHNLQFMGPEEPISAVLNGNGLSQRMENAFGAIFSISRSQQGNPMPFLMETAVMTSRTRGSIAQTWWILAITGILIVLIGPWILLYMLSGQGLERLGNTTVLAAGGWDSVHRFMMQYHLPDIPACSQMAIGAVVTLLLILLQRLWILSPFHPVGYAICGSWGTGIIWMPFLIAWIIKVVANRYGGNASHRVLPLVGVGLILGEFAAGTVWTILSYALHTQCYQIWLF